MKSLINLVRWILGLVAGITLSLALVWVVGESPWHVLGVIVASGTGTWSDLAQSLFYSTSFMFTGLSVAVALRAGLFNIGSEGQLLIGTLGSTAVVLALAPRFLEVSSGLSGFFLVFILSFSFGALWGSIPGALKAQFNSHEVVTTMMLNFIAAAFTSYLVTTHLQNPEGQNPETSLVPDYFRSTSWDPVYSEGSGSQFNMSFFVAILACLFFWWFFKKSKTGHSWDVYGLNPTAARFNGIAPKKVVFWALLISGGLSGLVALNEVFGSLGKLRLGFSADYGFVGIAVALMARNHPLAVIPSAVLFGVLQKGSTDLSLETEMINRDFAKIIQAVIVLSVLVFTSERLGGWLQNWLRSKNRGVL